MLIGWAAFRERSERSERSELSGVVRLLGELSRGMVDQHGNLEDATMRDWDIEEDWLAKLRHLLTGDWVIATVRVKVPLECCLLQCFKSLTVFVRLGATPCSESQTQIFFSRARWLSRSAVCRRPRCPAARVRA